MKNRKTKILITGIGGFIGAHLAEYCLGLARTEIFGTVLPKKLGGDAEKKKINHISKKIKLFECDLTDKISTTRILRKIQPDKIFHLAAQSSVSDSWQLPKQTLWNNVIAELNIFEALRELKMNPIIQIAGSSEEYGLVQKNELPVKETNVLRPLSPYAISKIGQDMLAFQYHKSYGLKTVITRCFNTEGPGRGRQFVISSFAYQIAAIEKGLQKPVINVGNLNAFRDFNDVRDVVRALWLATEKCNFGQPYNIGSGKVHQIKEVLQTLLFLTKKQIKIKIDPKLMRPSDVPIIFCDSTKFKKATGWKPKINFKTTLLDTLNYWREELNS